MRFTARRPTVSIPIPALFRASERRTPERPCLNCGDPTPGNFCRNCGQRKVEVQVSLVRMLMEALDDQFSINSALPRTVGALLARPGRLTREYMNGRIVRYIPPFRLYLVTSVLFFLALSLLPALRNPDLALSLDQNGLNVRRDATASSGGGDIRTRSEPRLGVQTQGGGPRFQGGRGELPSPPLPPGTGTQAAGGIGAGQVAAAAAAPGIRPVRLAGPPRPPAPPVGMRWLQGVRANTGNAVIDSMVDARIAHFQRLGPHEAMKEVVSTFLSRVPQMMFLMLPIFAALLKVLYVKSRKFYVEHFVFALHLHSFCFVSFLVMIVARWQPLILALCCWMMLYLLLAMKKVYGQGWFATLFKYGVLGMVYAFVVTTAASLTLLASVLLV